MSKKTKTILKIALFGVILISVIAGLSAAADPIKWFDEGRIQNRNARLVAMLKEPEDTIEVANIGDSLSLTGFSPMEIWRVSGITAVNVGADGLRMMEAYYNMVDTVESQHPKVMMLESLMLFRYSFNNDAQELISEPLNHRFAFLKYHSLWKTYVEKLGNRIYHKGYLVNENVAPYEGPADYMSRELEDGGRTTIPEFNRRLLEKMAKYCRDNDVELIIYSMPSALGYNYERTNTLQAVADEIGVKYLDLNTVEGLDIDWENDTNDGGDHINYYGAVKTAPVFAKYLKENSDVTDRRGDPAYAYWYMELADYDQLVIAMDGKSFQDLANEEKEAWRQEMLIKAGRKKQ